MKSSAASKRKRPARQTRLNFTPVASSSPAAAHLSPQVRDRAAAVSYDGSPSPMKRRKVEVEDIANSFKALPTPDQSSQAKHRGKSAASNSEQLRRQLDFGDSTRGKGSSRRGGSTMGASASRPEGFGRREKSKAQVADSSSSSTDSEDELPANPERASRRKRASTRSTKAPVIRLSSDENETPKGLNTRSGAVRKVSKVYPLKIRGPPIESSSPGLRGSGRSTKDQKPVIISSAGGTDSDSSGEVIPKSTKKTQIVVEDEDESSSDKMPDSSPIKKPRKAANNRRRQRSNSFEVPDDVVESEEDDDDNQPVITLRKRGRKPQIRESEDDEEDAVITSPRKRLRRPTKGKVLSSTEEDEKEDDVIPPQRRRRPKTPNPQDHEDLQEDLEFLGSSSELFNKGRRQLGTPKQNAKRTALEELKRRRAGGKIETNDTPKRKKVPARVVEDTSDEESEEGEGLGGEDDDASEYRSDMIDMFHEDDDDAGFVVDEDDNGENLLGAPNADGVQMPLQFTDLARAPAKDLFRYAIDWMVQKKINPAFERTDEVYVLAFRKLEDEVKGLAGSKFVSSVWRPDFTRAIKARPNYNVQPNSGFSTAVGEDCQACNRKNHPATFSIQFSGKPYDFDTLEDLDSSDDSEEEESDENDGKERDGAGNVLPEDGKWFAVGSTCSQNAEMAHILQHWRYHLNEWVVEYLIQQGYCTPEQLIERDRMNDRKRQRCAEKIVDEMEGSGKIKRLYKDYKDQIKLAQEAKHDGSKKYIKR